MLTDKEIRAKLISRGFSELNDTELLSIIIGEGANGISAHNLANNIISALGGSLGELSNCSIPKLRMIESLGVKRAVQIASAVELGIRVNNSAKDKIRVITSNEDIITIFRPLIGRLLHEEVWVVYLSSVNTILDKVRVSQGGVTGAYVDHKIVIKRAIELLASSIILVHNHPSGSVKPSQEDINLTTKLTKCAALFDIILVDHMIISADLSFSFRNSSML